MKFFRFLFLALFSSSIASTQVPIGKFTYDGAVLINSSTGAPYTASGGGDATAANQVTGNNSLATITTQTARFPYLSTQGQGTVGIIAAATSNCTTGTPGCNMLDPGNVPWTDTRGYGLIEIKVVSSTNTGAYIVETADDSSGTNAMTQTCYYYGQSLSNTQVSFPVTLTSSINYRIFCPLQNGYTRVRITTTTGASSSYSLYASNQPAPYTAVQQLTTPWAVSLSAATTGGYTSVNMTTNTTTTHKSGAGTLHTAVISTRGVTSSLICYDALSATGNKLTGTIDTTLSTTSFLFDSAFTTGLTCVTAGGTPADLVITYK